MKSDETFDKYPSIILNAPKSSPSEYKVVLETVRGKGASWPDFVEARQTGRGQRTVRQHNGDAVIAKNRHTDIMDTWNMRIYCEQLVSLANLIDVTPDKGDL